MADPRNTVEFEGIGGEYVTFLHDTTIVYNDQLAGGAAQVGLAVTLTGNADRTVSTVGNNERVLGKLVLVESDGKCTVQTGGFTSLPGGTSATLTIGSMICGDLLVAAEGYIQTATDGDFGRGFIVDNDTTTAVIVKLNS